MLSCGRDKRDGEPTSTPPGWLTPSRSFCGSNALARGAAGGMAGVMVNPSHSLARPAGWLRTLVGLTAVTSRGWESSVGPVRGPVSSRPSIARCRIVDNPQRLLTSAPARHEHPEHAAHRRRPSRRHRPLELRLRDDAGAWESPPVALTLKSRRSSGTPAFPARLALRCRGVALPLSPARASNFERAGVFASPRVPDTRYINGTRMGPRGEPQHRNYGRTPTARDATMTIVKSEIALSIIINILARRVSGKASVGLNAVAVLYPRNR